jgi:hypothetical protein
MRTPTASLSLWLLASQALLAGCRSPSSEGTAPRPEAGPSALRGKITVAGAPAVGAELLIIREGKVAAVLAAAPYFEVPDELVAACGELRLLVRLAVPIGAVLVTPPAGCRGELAVDVPASAVAVVRGSIVPPAGVAFDWAELKLTPRLPGVDPAWILAEGATTNLRQALAVQRLTSPSFELRLLAGAWWLSADRTIDAPVGTRTQNLRLDALTSTGSGAPAAEYGGYALTLTDGVQLQLTMRAADAP